MSLRAPLNSNVLRKRFSKVYEDFFAGSNLVASGCFSIPWCPSGVGHQSHSIVIKNKIPLRCYVGISARNDNEVIFRDVNVYQIEKDTFESTSYEKMNKEVENLKEEIRQFLQKYGHSGVNISILSEVPRGHSFNFLGTSSALISCVLHTITGECIHEDITNLDCHPELFRKIFLFAWKMEYVSRYRNSIGQSIWTTLTKNTTPGFVYSEKFDSNSAPEKIEQIPVGYFDFSKEFRDISENAEIPLDYAVIFSGNPINTKQLEESRKGDEKRFSDFRNFAALEILSKMKGHKKTPVHIAEEQSSFYDHFIGGIEILNLKTIELMHKALSLGYDEDLIDEFIMHINDYRSAVSLIEKQSRFADDFLYLFRKNRSNTSEKVGILPSYSGKLGGGYLIALRPGMSCETLKKTLDDLKEIYPNACLEYYSPLDSDKITGVEIEQFATESMYSGYTQRGQKVIFKTFNGEIKILSQDDIFTKTSGLIVDAVHKKIYFNGEKLTSKEFASQATTAELLDLLSENSGSISSAKLPLSSYSRNKNEMIGKIISPLSRFFKEKMGQDLHIGLSGGVMEFLITLENTDIPIGIVKKL